MGPSRSCGTFIRSVYVEKLVLTGRKPFIETPMGRTYLFDEFVTQATQKLLHPAASTIDILEVYMRTIEYFQKLDPTRVLTHRITGPFRNVLNCRDETVRIILTSMLNPATDEHGTLIESHDDYCAPIAQMVAVYLNKRFEEYFDGVDLHNLDWQPEPLDARPGESVTCAVSRFGQRQPKSPALDSLVTNSPRLSAVSASRRNGAPGRIADAGRFYERVTAPSRRAFFD